MNFMQTVPEFNVHSEPDTISVRWKHWLQRFETYTVAFKITDSIQKKALLLFSAGMEVQNIHDTLELTDPPPAQSSVFDHTVSILNKYFIPKTNSHFERFKFRETKQLESESIDAYHLRLRKLISSCDFSDIDSELMTHIISTCTSSTLKTKALQNGNLTLTDLLNMARALEITETQISTMEASASKQNKTAFHVKHKQNWKPDRQNTWKIKNKQDVFHKKDERICYYCGNQYPHVKGQTCPAYGKTCRNCGRLNHFASVCKKTNQRERSKTYGNQDRNKYQPIQKQINEIGPGYQTTENSEHLIFRVNSMNENKTPKTYLTMGGKDICFLIDTGASCNVIDYNTFESLHPKPNLLPSTVNIYSYGASEPMQIIGEFYGTIKKGDQVLNDVFFVVKSSHMTTSLIGYPLIRRLNLMRQIYSIDAEGFEEDVKIKNADLFEGIGKLKGTPLKLHINENVTPVAQPHRRIPFHLRQKVDQETQSLLDQDIIEPVKGPTPWVSPVVLVPKPDDPEKLRLCVDMRLANTAIERVRHPAPTLDDLMHDLNGATVFSKLDLAKAYHQLELDEESRYITTFSTHSGLFRYKRLSFGINSASEMFQNSLEQILSDIPGARNVSDDILVFGKNDEDHDENLKQTLHRLREVNLKLSKKKCIFKKRELRFYGLIFNASGVHLDPERVESIREMEAPISVAELQSFLGMVTYCSKFIPHFSEVTEPLRSLLKKNAHWEWNERCENAFQMLKNTLLQGTTLSYFDPHKQVALTVDASALGLGAVIGQQSDKGFKPISYASKALTETEKKYSSIEREMLAVKWACQKFRLYLIGQKFTVYTDHKPLISLVSNPRSKTSIRLERWMLALQEFNFEIKHISGKANSADFLSRHPSHSPRESTSEENEEFVNIILKASAPIALNIDIIRTHVQDDPTLAFVKRCLDRKKWPKGLPDSKIDNPMLQLLYKVRHELAVVDEIILRGDRILIPKSLQQHTVDIAHEAHLGIVKTKALLREKVWFPELDKLVEKTIKNCLVCQVVNPDSKPETFQMSKLPQHAWRELSVDFYGPLPDGNHVLVVIDDYSRFPVIEMCSSTSAKCTILALNKILSLFGIPQIIRTDNGTPFQSVEFSDFAKEMGFTHRKVTPYWPASNGLVERFMKSIGKTLQAATAAKIPLEKALHVFLRNYRETPHMSTGKSPAEVLFNRKTKGKLPGINDGTLVFHNIQGKDEKSKLQMQTQARKRVRIFPRNIQKNDEVLTRDLNRRKISPFYEPTPYVVTEACGNRITASNAKHTITRNASFFKKVMCENNQSIQDDSTSILTGNQSIGYGSQNASQDVDTSKKEERHVTPHRYNLRRNIRRKRLFPDVV